MTTTDIKDLMLYGERINIEYKETAGDLPKLMWEAIQLSPTPLAETLS